MLTRGRTGARGAGRGFRSGLLPGGWARLRVPPPARRRPAPAAAALPPAPSPASRRRAPPPRAGSGSTAARAAPAPAPPASPAPGPLPTRSTRPPAVPPPPLRATRRASRAPSRCQVSGYCAQGVAQTPMTFCSPRVLRAQGRPGDGVRHGLGRAVRAGCRHLRVGLVHRLRQELPGLEGGVQRRHPGVGHRRAAEPQHLLRGLPAEPGRRGPLRHASLAGPPCGAPGPVRTPRGRAAGRCSRLAPRPAASGGVPASRARSGPRPAFPACWLPCRAGLTANSPGRFERSTDCHTARMPRASREERRTIYQEGSTLRIGRERICGLGRCARRSSSSRRHDVS